MNTLSSTNRQDPDSIKSRIFIGNLNTVKMTRAEVSQIFSKYGEILGISMHKGYAFVQYSNEYEARFAVDNEDSKNYYGKDLDVTVASEPKARKRVRSNVPMNQTINTNIKASKAGIVDLMAVKTAPTFTNPFPQIPLPVINSNNQLNVFSNFLNQSPLTNFTSFQPNPTFNSTKNNLSMNNSGAKRTRLDPNNTSLTHHNKTSKNLVPIITNPISSSKSLTNRTSGSNRTMHSIRNNDSRNYRNLSHKNMSMTSLSETNFSEDILLCGRCRKCFDSVEDLMSHKLAGCNLGKKSKDSDSAQSCKVPGEPSSLDCFYCGQNFYASWDLISHCEVKHDVKIYSLPEKKNQSSSECEFLDNEKESNSVSRNTDDEEEEHSGAKRKTDSNYSPSNNSEVSSISIQQPRKSEEIPEPDCTLVTLCTDEIASDVSDNDDQNDEINLKLSSPKLAPKRKTTSSVEKINKKSTHTYEQTNSMPRNRLRSEVSRHEANPSSDDDVDQDEDEEEDEDDATDIEENKELHKPAKSLSEDCSNEVAMKTIKIDESLD